jgi:hypothetical protein
MVSHGMKHVFKKPTPNLSSSDRTNQLRSKTVYAGTVELSNSLAKPGSNRYKTYNGPFEIAKKNIYTSPTLVASTSYKDLLDITQGKVLLNQLPLTNQTYNYYAKNFANGEMYAGNYQQFNGSVFSNTGPTGCVDSVLTYDLTSTGFTGPGSYTGNSIGLTGPTGTIGSNQNIFIDPKHCYYSNPCTLSESYLNFVSISITGPSQYFAQQIINSDQYRGFSFPMSNFTLSCTQQNDEQSTGPLFCPVNSVITLSNFNISSKTYDDLPFQITPPTSNSEGAFTYSSSNTSVATVSGTTITILAAGSSVITASQAATGIFPTGSISTTFIVNKATPNLSNFNIPSKNYGDSPFQITQPPASNSSGAFTYSSSNTSVATVSGTTITILAAGSSVITASQAATDNFNTNTISTTFTVLPISPNLSLALPVQNNNGIPYSFSLSGYTNSQNNVSPFSYSSDNTAVATITGPNSNQVTINGPGSSNITVSQTAFGNYLSESETTILYVSNKIYDRQSDDITKSFYDPPINGTTLTTVFGTVIINNGDQLINATIQYIEYDATKPLYLYFFNARTFNLANLVQTFTFSNPPPIPNVFTLPSPVTWNNGSGTFYATWSQMDITTGQGANQNLHITITDLYSLHVWQWSGSIFKLA